MSSGEPAIPAARAALSVDARADSRLAQAGERLAAILDDAVGGGYPAGATLVVADASGELITITAGWSCTVGDQIATSQITRYDVASLTKVVCTVPLVMALAERGVWDLDDALSRRLDGYPNPDTTLRQLLTHTSGLPAHREFYRLQGGPAAIREAVFAESATGIQAGDVCYSDLGFMLLGWTVEQCAGAALDDLFQTIVATPLKLKATRFRPAPSDREITAATELDGDQRLEPGLVWGEVHDGNAWALGGVAGHAGLFAPAEDLVRYVGALLTPEAHPVLSAQSIAEMTRRQAGAPPDVRALGWRLDAGEWGPWPERTFWHTGFTGTVVWADPMRDLSIVFLTNGVYFGRSDLREIRAAVCDAVVAEFAP